jgi:SAM-dependent methyltransferase
VGGRGVDRPSWAGEGVDLDRPSVARIYDYFLGGSHHFAVDREMAERLRALAPDVGDVMRANRAFLRRAVRYLLEQGVDQFLDIGSGIPTVGNVHEVARIVHPGARVVYVDIDPVAVAHSRALLAGDPQTAVVAADLRDTRAILGSPEVARLIDPARPTGLLIVSVLHFMADLAPIAAAVAELRNALAPGSFLAISHAVRDSRPDVDEFTQIYEKTGAQPVARTVEEIEAFFGDFTMIDPGLVFLPLWRPDSAEDIDEHPERFVALAGVGQKH